MNSVCHKFSFTFAIIGALILMSSCKSIYISDLAPTGSISTKLPPLQSRFDMSSLTSVFGVSNTQGTATGAGRYIGGNTYMGYTDYDLQTTQSPSINDLQVMFEHEVRNNICNRWGTPKGYAVCKILGGSNRSGGGIYTCLSILGGYCFVNLLGVPFGTAHTDLQIRVDIYNSADALVGTYTSPYVKKKVFRALYYGYTKDDGKRKSAIDAFKACMDDIKAQISKDSQRLQMELY